MEQKVKALLDRARDSRAMLLAVIYLTYFLDYLLLTAIVPIIPNMLVGSDVKESEQTLTQDGNDSFVATSANRTLCSDHNNTLPDNSKISDAMERIVLVPVRAIDENSRVGLILSSKAVVQLIANPVVGLLSNRVSYQTFLLFGVCIFLASSLLYAFAETFVPLLLARALQGVGSAATTISGMSLVAGAYTSDEKRSRAMGIVMGGSAMGILVGYPFGGVLYAVSNKAVPFFGISALCAANIGLQLIMVKPDTKHEVESKPSAIHRLLMDPHVLICAGAIMFTSMSLAVLESTVPIWIMDTMDASAWELGLIFIPDSIGYLVGTNFFPVIAQARGRWIFSASSFLVLGIGLIAIPFCSTILELVVPHLCLGLGVGVVDAVVTPLLALLVDMKHLTTYGSVYAVFQLAVCLAYSLGPAVAGVLVKAVGFRWSMWGLALTNLLYTPLNWFLRNPSFSEDLKGILTSDEEEVGANTENVGLTNLGNGCSYKTLDDVAEGPPY